MFKAVITTVVMALSEKQKNCSSDKTTTVCGDFSESLQLPTKPHSRGCESTYNKVLFTPPTMCRLTLKYKENLENHQDIEVELKQCAEIIAETDLQMMNIRNKIEVTCSK